MKDHKTVSRRQFIRVAGTAVVASGVGAGNAAAAIASPETAAAETGAAVTPTLLKAARTFQGTGQVPAEWDADVIVVGMGGAGLVAAVWAADTGAKVLQLEKTEAAGGCWMVSGGSSSAAVTRIQLEAGSIDDSAELFYKDCMRMGKFKSDPEILKWHTENAGLAVDWLDSLGAYKDRTPQPDIYQPPFTVQRSYNADGGGKGFYAVVQAEHQKRVDRGDVKLMMQTRATELLVENGRVVGLKIEDANGKAAELKAGAVILATGGYTNNVDLVKKYNYPQAVSTALPHCTGDGHIMCEQVGAAFVDMDYLPPYLGGVADPDTPGKPLFSVNMNMYPGAIWVDLNGQRVVNEDIGALHDTAKHALAAAPESTLVVIFDKAIMEANDPIVANKTWDEIDAMAEEGKSFVKAGTLDDLAKALGIDAVALAETVAAYNGYVDKGKDEAFDRQELKFKIEMAPFYAIKTVPSLLLSKGGPKINNRMQVINSEGKIIPGLYVAGELAGGSKVSGHGNVTGVANTLNVTSGRRAGEMATQEALSRRPA